MEALASTNMGRKVEGAEELDDNKISITWSNTRSDQTTESIGKTQPDVFLAADGL